MKMERLIGILSILLQRENVTAPELAEQFEVSRRTIQRDIESLCRAGIPISTAQGAGGGISIMEGYRVDRTVLTDPEMQAILAGLRSLDSISGTRRYAQLMEKLSAGTGGLVPGSAHMLIDLSSWYKTSLPPKIELIQGAIEQHHNTVHQRTQTHVQLHRLYDKAGEISAAIFRISSLQDCFFLRRQVEGKFLFFAHVDLLSGACPLFFPCGSRHCGITTAELIFLSGFAPIFNAHGNS